MDEKSSLNSLKREDDFALFLGLIFAVVHFGTTVGVLIGGDQTDSLVHDLFEFIGIILLAPSITLTTLFSNIFQIDLPAVNDFSLFSLLLIVYSSALYGITTRLLASNQRLLRQLGAAAIILLTLSSCCVLGVYY
jgi:hypothetical protein